MRASEFKIPIAVLLTAMIVVVLVYEGETLGFSADFTDDFLHSMPGVVTFIVGAGLLLTQGKSIFALPGFGVLS